jgi:hypothetical protein
MHATINLSENHEPNGELNIIVFFFGANSVMTAWIFGIPSSRVSRSGRIRSAWAVHGSRRNACAFKDIQIPHERATGADFILRRILAVRREVIVGNHLNMELQIVSQSSR